MDKIGKSIVKHRWLIIIVSLFLMIPSVFGMLNTRINYDMLDYLPDDTKTVQGQQILMDDFGKGGFSIIVVEGMEDQDVASLKAKIEQVNHVDSVLWYDTFMDMSVPMEMLPDTIYDAFNNEDATMLAVFFDTSLSADETLTAIDEIRQINDKQVFVSGASAMVADLKNLSEREETIYVGLAVLLTIIGMLITLDNWLIPFIFIGSIGVSILLNLGTNYFLGEISFVTKALAAVLQLAVTLDYSIFLWHSYEEERETYEDEKEAMAHAVSKTITSVTGSSTTTIAGFIALCFMSYSLGVDLGIVMAKGVIIGVIGCITFLPSIILITNKVLMKFNHHSLIPNMDKLVNFIVKHYKAILIIAILVLIPGYYGKQNTKIYYNLAERLSVEYGLSADDVPFSVANEKLAEYFNVGSTEMILCDAKMPAKDAKKMLEEIESLDGVTYALGMNSIVDGTVPESLIPTEILSQLKSDKYQIMIVNSEYAIATDEANNQITQMNSIIEKYDQQGSLIGEAPLTKDLIEITDHDFNVVSMISSVAIFIIIFFVMKSISLPFILVAVIQLAIIVNLGIPYYTNTTLPFIAPICITTIQLGATVDYAILMSVRYKSERQAGADKKEAVSTALAVAIPSIIVSAIGLFAATFGVSVYSNIDIISSICSLMARGAIISMITVIFGLPSMLMLFDKVICKTTIGMKNIGNSKTEENNYE